MGPARPVMTSLRQANQDLNIREYQAREVSLASRPLAVFVELTQNCNLRCPMCRSGGEYRPDWNMSFELYERVAAELFSTAMVVDLRGWGESTIHRSFKEAVDLALGSGARIRLVSNGQVHHPEIWDRLMAAHSLVAISCDAASPRLFNWLRGGGRLDRLLRVVADLVAKRDRHGASGDSVSLSVTVSTANLPELSAIVALAASLGVRKVSMFPIQIGLHHALHLRHDLDGVKRALDLVEREARRHQVEVRLGAALDPSLVVDGRTETDSCIHPWSYCYVSFEGRLGFCDHLIGSPKYTFGSLRETSFESVWNGEGFRELRRGHAAGLLADRFAPCRWCKRQRYVDFEDLLHPGEACRVVDVAGGSLYTPHPPEEFPIISFGH